MSRALLEMVALLHARGYQRLRIEPGLSPSGLHWRCAIGAYRYSSSQGQRYWDDLEVADAQQLADLFEARVPLAAYRGADPAYVAWYREMLARTAPDGLPIAYADYDLPADGLAVTGSRLTVPFPPVLQ